MLKKEVFIMSIKNVEKFLNLAKADEDLKIKLVDVSRSLQKNGGKIPNEEKFIKDKIVPLARKKGVLFTAKDFLKYADKQVTTLSEEDLLNVSGGLSNRSTAAVLLTTFLGSLGVGAAVNLSNLAQDDQISISARKGNTDGGEKFSHENSDEYETKTENNGVIPKIPGLDGNVKTAQNSSAEKREESQPSVGENNIEENVVEAKQKNTTAQENLRKVMQNKNVVLPNTNINPVELQAENPVLDATEINITGEGHNAAGVPWAGGMPPEAKIENDSVEFQDDGSGINDSISQTGSIIFDSVSASSEDEVNKNDDSVVNDSMLSTKSSFWGSGSRRFPTSSESTLNKGDGSLVNASISQMGSRIFDSFRSSSGSSSGFFGKGSADDSVIHKGSSKFNISSTTDEVPGSSMKRSQSFSDLNLLASKDLKDRNKILKGSTESLGISMNSANNSTSSMEAENFDSTGSFTGSFGSELGVQNAGYNSFAADLVIVKDGNIRYAYYGDPNEHVYEFDETTGTLTIFKDFAADETAYFDDWDEFIGDIKKVVIRDGVTSIDKDAFSGCSKLTEITIPATVTSIGNNAFTDCSNLTEITIPGKVTSIGASAFSGCSKLTEITIPATVTSIGNNAFTDCSNLTEITIPGKVTSIGTAAFLNCSKLTKIAIPASVTSIGADAFNGCSSLTEITIPASVASIGAYAFANCSELKNVSFEGKDSPNYGGYLIFCDCPDDLVINVIEDYEGDEFCGLNVIKGAQLQGETDASTNVGHMDEEDESSQPGFFKSAATSVYKFFTNIFSGSDSSVGKGSIDDKSDDDGNPLNNWYGDANANDLQTQIPVQQQSQTSSENDAQGQAQQLQASSENNAQAQAQQLQASSENNAQTPQQDKDEVEAKNFLDDAFNEAEKKLAEARWAEDKLAVFKSLNFPHGEGEYESFDFESGTYSNEELAEHILKYLDNFESLTPRSQRELMMDTIALFARVENKEENVYELDLLFDYDTAISQEDRQKLEAFYFEKVEPHWWEIGFPTNEYEELLTINNEPKTVDYILEFLALYLDKFNNNELDGRSRDVLLHYIDDLLYKFYDEENNEIKVPLAEDNGEYTKEEILEKMLNIAKENILNQGEGDTKAYEFSKKEAAKAAAISIALVGLTAGAAYTTAYVTVSAPVLSGISFWGDANIENAKAKITNGINTVTASATNIANALKSKLSSGLSAVKDLWNGKSTPIEKTAAYFGGNPSNIPINFPELGADKQQKLGRRQIPTVPRSYLDDQEVNLPLGPQQPKPEPETHNNLTNSPFNMDGLHWQGAGNSTQPANATQTQMPTVAPSSSWQGAGNSTQSTNATPMQNPAPQPNNYTAANANITNNLTASETNIANALKSKARSGFSAIKDWWNGKRTPIEKTAAYFGDNPSNIPINFPELGADEQQKPGRRQETRVLSYLDDQEVNLPRGPQQPKLEPETHNNLTNSPFNMDGLHWQGAGNSTQPANAPQPQMPAVASSSSWQGAGNSTQSTNATQTQMPTVDSNSSKNISENVVKGIGVGVAALGVAAAAIAKQNSYSDERVTYNGVTKTLTIKQNMTLDLDNFILNHAVIGIDEAKTIVISDGVEEVILYGKDFPNVKKIIVSQTVSDLAFDEEEDSNFKSLKEIEVARSNTKYKSINGVLFNKDKKGPDLALIKFPQGKTDKEYKVPENVKCIAWEAFYSCPNLERITMENDLALEKRSFCFCSKLKEVWFNSPIQKEKNKNQKAFYVCNNAKLYMPNMDQSKLPDELYWLEVEKVTSDKVNNFNSLYSYDETTKTLIIKQDMGNGVDKSIPDYKSIGIEEAQIIIIASGVGNVNFSVCEFKKVKKIVVSESVYWLNFDEADFDSLEEIEVSEENSNYTAENGVLFNEDGTQLIKFPAGKADKEYEVPKSVECIKGEAFDTCPNLEKITINSDLKLKSLAFSWCENLKEVWFNSTTDEKEKNYNAFNRCDNAKVYMLSRDQAQLPKYFGGLDVVPLPTEENTTTQNDTQSPASETAATQNATQSPNNGTVPAPQEAATSNSPFSYDNNTKTLTIKGNLKREEDFDDNDDLLNIPLEEVKTVVIDSGSTDVYLSLINAELSKLEIIIIPASVTRLTLPISPALKKFEVDENNQNYKSIDGVLFTKNGEELVYFPRSFPNTEYTVPQNVKVIKNGAFCFCENLERIITENKDLKIEMGAFYGCKKLNAVVFTGKEVPTEENRSSFFLCGSDYMPTGYMPNVAREKRPLCFWQLSVAEDEPAQQQP